MKGFSNILGLKLSPSRPEHLYVVTSSGTLVQWDWEAGKELAVYETFQKTISFEICRMASFYIREKKDGRRQISISPLDGVPSSKQLRESIVLETTKPISTLKVLQGGRVLIACDGQHVIIGSSDSSRSLADSPVYIWREIRLPVKITCLDVRENPSPSESIATSATSSDEPVTVDLAVGDTNGTILVYHDIANILRRTETMGGTQKKSLPLLRKLHWHREGVSSLRWSRDGKFLLVPDYSGKLISKER
jgi:NET1-associated nuclear protein 1 (U3 small nucleolar RNA-associated protein 17)